METRPGLIERRSHAGRLQTGTGRFRRITCASVVVATVLATLPTPTASASVESTVGQMEQVVAPPSVEPGKYTSVTSARVFPERARFVLTSPLSIDFKAPGTYSKAIQVPTPGLAPLAAGTLVNSHLVHVDTNGSLAKIDGTVTFAEPIIGVITRSGRLDATDFLGAPGTLYKAGKLVRGLEFQTTAGDKVTISSNQRTLRLISNTTTGLDDLRVLTEPVVTATLSADTATIGAGESTVPLENIPSTALTASSDPDSTQAAAFSSAQLAATAMRRIDLSQTSLGTIAMRRIAMRRISLGADRLNTILLSDVPVQGGWAALLAGTEFQFSPLQTVTLGDVIDLPQVGLLNLAQLDLSRTILGAIPAVAISLGSLELADIPLTDAVADGTPEQRLQAWCDALGAGACASYGIDPNVASSADGVTVVSLSVAGADLSTIAMRRIAMRRIDLAETGLGTVAMRRIAMRRIDNSPTVLGALTVGAIPVAARSSIFDCGLIDCSDTALTLASMPTNAIIGTVADLFALAGQSAELDAVLDQLTLEDVFPGVLPAGNLAWENLDLRATPLQNLASPLEPVVTYSLAVSVGGGASLDLSVDFSMAQGFAYSPGSAALDGLPVPDPAILADGVLQFDLADVAPGLHTLVLGNRAGIDLGPKAASATVTVGSAADSALVTEAVPITVVEAFEQNGSSSDFKTFAPDTLYVSHISSATDTDLFRFDVNASQAASGASASIFLGNLPTDYDLKLYGPPPVGVVVEADESQSSVADFGLDGAPQESSVAPDLVNDVPTASGLGAVVAVSASRDLQNERIETGTLVAGTYWVQVSGYNGAFSGEPYVLRQQVNRGTAPPTCQPRVPAFTPSAAGTLADPNSYPNDLDTIFLVAQQRMLSTYEPARVQAVLDAATAVGGMAPTVVGEIVPVDWDPLVADAYTAWSGNRCSPEAAQQVANAISGVVDRIRAARPSLRNVVVVGDDTMIPMARVLDGTAISNERTHAESVGAETTNNELVGSIAAGRVLTDDVYGAPRVIAIDNSTRRLYLPRLAVGRLVESPEDITAALERFVEADGQLDPMTVAGSSSIVTGYDFLTDGTNAVASALAGKTTPRPSLINETWNAQDLFDALFASTPPSVASINAHFDQSRLLPAEGNATGSESDLFTVDDITRAGELKLLGRVLFSMGCHAGLSVSDVAVGTPTPDWAQTLTGEGQGALWAANTGYGYGDTELVAYSEKLMAFFATELGNDASIGGALTAAKNRYKSETQPLSPYDEKVLQEVVLYGLPMYRPAGSPAAGIAAAAAELPAAPTLVTEPTLGLPTAPVSMTLTQSATSGPDRLHAVDTASGRYYEVDGKTIQVQYRPVQPLVTRDVTESDGEGGLAQVAHGALITGLTSIDELSYTPYYSRPLIDQTENEELGESIGDAVFPASILRVNSTVDPNGEEIQTLAVVPGQFRPDLATPGSGTERLFTSVQSLVHYTDPSDNDFTAPTILRSTGSVVNGTGAFTADTDDTAQRVYVLYKGSGTTGPSAWQGIDLVRTPGTDHWTGGGLISSPEIEYFVQAGDTSGNWGTSNNKASDFLGTEPAPPAEETYAVEVSGATQVNGWYVGGVSVTVTGSGLLSTSLDGAAFTPYTGPVPVAVDGLHVFTVTDGNGNTSTTLIPIDLTAPTVAATIAPDEEPGADGWRRGPVTVTINGVDGGGSGIDAITYSAAGAESIPATTGPGSSVSFPLSAIGTTTVTFSATDTSGKVSGTGSVAVKIDPDGPTVACDGAPAEWSALDVAISCTAVDAGSGLANPADVAFSLTTVVAAGVETANASTGSRSVCDLVANCATGGPVTGIKVDRKAPTVAITSPASDAQIPQGAAGIEAVFTCVDGGSGMTGGLASCTGSINGGPPVPSGTDIDTSTLGPLTMSVTGVDAVGNTATATRTASIVDSHPPTVVCGSAPSGWNSTNVLIACTASDAGSGLATPADAAFSLTTAVAAGVETANASTNQRAICDLALNCATAGPVTGIKVDRKGPTVAITSPSSDTQIPQGQVGVTAQFTCADAGSGMTGGLASCTASVNGSSPVVSGAVISTSALGPVTIVVTGVDAVGNTATATRTVTVVAVSSGPYRISLLYNPSTAVKKGTKIAITLQLKNASGQNVSSASHVVTATDVDWRSAPPANVEDGTNYGTTFRLVTSSSQGAHYRYLLPTSSYSLGWHLLRFKVDGVSVFYYLAPFKLKA